MGKGAGRGGRSGYTHLVNQTAHDADYVGHTEHAVLDFPGACECGLRGGEEDLRLDARLGRCRVQLVVDREAGVSYTRAERQLKKTVTVDDQMGTGQQMA